MSELASDFVNTPPRESSGSRSSNRFKFQQSWVLCKILLLHEEGVDYLVVFDYHEDVVVFDSIKDMNVADFYQVKSKKTGNWTINSLAKGEKESILGKLFGNHENFPELAHQLVFISNQHIKAKLESGANAHDTKLISFKELKGDDKEIIRAAVEGINTKFCDLTGLSKIKFEHVDLGVDEHATYAKGRLSDFFEHNYGTKTVPIGLAYRVISDEISRKNNYEYPCNSLDELKESKSLSRSQVNEMLSAVAEVKDFDSIWSEFITHASGKWGYGEVRSLEANCRSYFVGRMDVTNEQLNSSRKHICQLISTEIEPSMDLYSLVKTVKSKYESNPPKDSVFIRNSNYDLQAAIICEALINDPIQKAGQESAEEDE